MEETDDYSYQDVSFGLIGYNGSSTINIINMEAEGLPISYEIRNVTGMRGVTLTAVNASSAERAATAYISTYN